jgi:ABC-type oligopeptide transport system substrate-binding subunit
MKMNKFIIFKLILILLFLAFTGCASKVNDETPTIHQMTVYFSWPDNYGSCFDPNNPEIIVSNIPAGTLYFRVSVFDTLNNYDHGGGKVMNDGTGKIAYGSVPDYKGPCPRQSPHLYGIYEFQVSAHNANDEMIGIGKYSRRFPEET